MTLLILSLAFVLAYRLGVFQPWQEYRAQLAFKSEVHLLAAEAEWEERMERYRRQLAPIRQMPFIFVR
jgi:hypothetical protein